MRQPGKLSLPSLQGHSDMQKLANNSAVLSSFLENCPNSVLDHGDESAESSAKVVWCTS